MSKKKLWDIEGIKEAAHEIEFWQSEYKKRALMLLPQYNSLASKYKNFSAKWIEYLDKHDETSLLYRENFMPHLQYTWVCKKIEIQYIDYSNDINFLEKYGSFFDDPSIQKELDLFAPISFLFDYDMGELLSPTDMTALLQNLNEDNGFSLPKPPPIFMYKGFGLNHSKNILNLIRIFGKAIISISIDNNMNTILNLINIDSPTWNNITKQYSIQYCSQHEVQVVSQADFAIVGHALDPEFDFDAAMIDIHDHLIRIIYGQKHQHGLELTPSETKAAIACYKRMVLGEYGPNYRESRAIGLWLWDFMHQTKCKTQIEAIDALKKQGLNKSYQDSDERIYRRFLTNAKKCIKSGKVLASNARKK